ncbi:3321_t:CDS:2, partial [Cetraspora pellucida]
ITTEINVLSDNEESITNESDTENDIIETNLKVGNVFRDWDAVDNAVNMYAKRNRFVAIKSYKDLDSIDKNIVCRRVYSCWKAGTSNPRKVENISLHRDGISTKTNCSWQVSFYLKKKATVIDLTKFDNSHNHEYDPVTINLIPQNSRIPQKILVKIEHYTINGHLGTGQQYDLLVKEFPQYIIKKKGLYNAIQKFRGVQVHDESDASTMFLYLMKLRDYDNDYVVVPRLEGSSNELTGLYSYHQFEVRYNEMLRKYKPCWSYLEKKLYPSRESWAKYFTAKVFTAGVESTQRVEAINRILKKHLDRGTLLKKLVKVIEDELEKEAQYSRIKNYYGSNPSTGLPSTYDTIFKNIDSVLKDYLAPTPLSLQRAQMQQSLLYQGATITIDQVEEFDAESTGLVEHIYDTPQIRLHDLLSDINNDEIQEI